ncbi:hypothetical protein ACFVT5_11055 [Streptomyces sp. NPDC058001]|uniref:hypothetical protein n=1 Tax=Streptomyces sp. NPDC058001 TaxID=3346300 RepID=UPI0036EF0100
MVVTSDSPPAALGAADGEADAVPVALALGLADFAGDDELPPLEQPPTNTATTAAAATTPATLAPSRPRAPLFPVAV